MSAWLLSYTDEHKIIGIADGNGEITKSLDLIVDKTKNFMGMRSTRFAMIVQNNLIQELLIEKSGEYKISSAEHLFNKL